MVNWVTLQECPPGPFQHGTGTNASLGFKTEYAMAMPRDVGNGKVEYYQTNYPEAYCMESGEVFWGGAASHKERAEIMVLPVSITTWEESALAEDEE